VIRQSHSGVQQIKARDLVPGDIVDVSGKRYTSDHCHISYIYLAPPVAGDVLFSVTCICLLVCLFVSRITGKPLQL